MFHLATQATLQAIPAALAKAHQVYGVKDSKVIFVMNEDGRNFADWCQVRVRSGFGWVFFGREGWVGFSFGKDDLGNLWVIFFWKGWFDGHRVVVSFAFFLVIIVDFRDLRRNILDKDKRAICVHQSVCVSLNKEGEIRRSKLFTSGPVMQDVSHQRSRNPKQPLIYTVVSIGWFQIFT